MSEFKLETACGVGFDLGNPRVEDVYLEDVARALAVSARFNGHLHHGVFYSIAEHAVRVAHEVASMGGDRAACLYALHHDSHEAYLGDIPTPVKKFLGPSVIEEASSAIDAAIFQAFGIHPTDISAAMIRRADHAMLLREAATLKASGGTGPLWPDTDPRLVTPPLLDAGWDPVRAEKEFLRHHELFGGVIGLTLASAQVEWGEPMAVDHSFAVGDRVMFESEDFELDELREREPAQVVRVPAQVVRVLPGGCEIILDSNRDLFYAYNCELSPLLAEVADLTVWMDGHSNTFPDYEDAS